MRTRAKDRERGARKLSRSLAPAGETIARKLVSRLLAGDIPTSLLTKKIVGQGGIVPEDTPANVRTYFGRSLTLDRIEATIRNANEGRMREMVILSRETMELSGHLSSVVTKRMNRVAAGRINIASASGEDLDEDRAQEMADLVRSQFKQIPELGGALVDLAWSAFDGRSCQELDWNLTGASSTKWSVTGLNWILPMRLSLDSHRRVRIVDDKVETRGFSDVGFPVEETPWKFITCKPRLFGDLPEREGLARRSLYWTFFGRLTTRERLILMEIFGKPWRTAKGDPKIVDVDDDDTLEAIKLILDSMGASSSAVMPPGWEALLTSPPKGAGDVHSDIIKHSEEQISKLVLGQTNTTDSQPQGIGGSQAEKAQDAEDLIIASDWKRIGGYLTHQLALPIVVVNHGVEAAPYAPIVTVEDLEVPDPKKEGERAKDALSLGLKLSVEEVYQRTGWRRPGEDEAYVHNVQGPASATGIPGQAVATIVYPPGESPEPGELEQQPTIATIDGEENTDASGLTLTPSDLASVVTVNEARASAGLGSLLLPDGGEDPDGKLSVAEYKAKREAAGTAQGTAEGTPEPDPNAPPVPNDAGNPIPPGLPGTQPPQGNKPVPPQKPGNPKPPTPGR